MITVVKEFDQQEAEALKDAGTLVTQFLESGNGVLTEEELEATSPILNSLDESRYHFTKEHFLVAGGEKTISKVYDSQADRYVAIARPRRRETRSDMEQFLREARLTAKLQHPNILPVYEIGLDGEGVPYFVMRLLSGEGLKGIVRKQRENEADYRKTYSLDRLLSIFLDICDAVTYAHSHGVLHLDIKPSNVRVGRHGQTILYDWGLAKVIGGDETELDQDAEEFDSEILNDMTLSGMMKGTPGYMAPEQTVGKGTTTPRTDVYALGALLYFILTGHAPVKGNTVQELVRNTREGRTVNPRSRGSALEVPGSLSAVAMKALQVDPHNRYATVKEMAEEILRYQRGYATRAERAGIFKHVQLYGRRHSTILSAALLFFAVLAVVVGVSLVKVDVQRRAAETNFGLYRAEAERSSRMYGDMKAFMLRSATAGDFWDIDLMEKLILAEFDNDIDEAYRQELHWMMGIIAFIREEYHLAEDHFAKANLLPNSVLQKQARLGSEMKEDDGVFLTDAQFAKMLEMPVTKFKHRKQILYYAYYHRKLNYPNRQTSPEEHLPVAIGILNLINDTAGWGADLKLEPLGDGSYHLDLSGAPYSMFSPPQSTGEAGGFVSVLKQLELKSLDVSNTNVRDFSEFRRMKKLEILIARNVRIFDERETVYRLSNLEIKKLVVSSGMFSEKNLRKMRSQFKVEVVP
jgi:serine/threonine protein kinase